MVQKFRSADLLALGLGSATTRCDRGSPHEKPAARRRSAGAARALGSMVGTDPVDSLAEGRFELFGSNVVWSLGCRTCDEEGVLLRVASEAFNVSDKPIVRVLGRDGYFVAEAFLLNLRKTQERDMLSNVFSAVTKKRLEF